jgi:hypothetical protein
MKTKKHTKKKKTIFWHNFMYRCLYGLIDSPAAEVIFITTLILTRWWLNSDISYPVEIIIPILIFGILATIIFYAYRLVFGKGSAAHLAAILLTYAFYSYSYVQSSLIGKNITKAIPSKFRTDFTKSIFLAVVITLACGLVAYIFRKLIGRYKSLSNLQPYKVLLFAVVFIFGTQIIKCTQRYFEIKKELSYSYPASSLPAKPQVASSQNKPDIYYLLFDRYTSSDILKSNFHYDNSELLKFLNSKGFVNRNPAFSNYPFTTESVSSTLSMNYHTQLRKQFGQDKGWQTVFPYRAIFNKPPVAQALRQNGYTYNQVSSWWDFSRLRVQADNNYAKSYRLGVLGSHFYLSDFQRDTLNKSILSIWLKKGPSINKAPILKYELDRNPQENFNSEVASLKSIAASTSPSKPKFTFAHILAPHPPYVFDENGNWPSYDVEANDNDIPEKTKYINELKYINTRIENLIIYIREKSPNAVVFIQADEGPYPGQFRGEITENYNYNPVNLPLPEMKQKFGILASYYMPGKTEEDVKKINSSVDVFRYILNNYLGYNMPMLPDCQFAVSNKYNVYNFQLVSDRVKGISSPAECSQYQ